MNVWFDFINNCSTFSFADTKLEDASIIPMKKGIIRENILVNINDIVGSDCKKNITWLELLKSFNRAEIDHGKCIHKIAKEEYNRLSENDYAIIKFNNKYFISDGHNRLVFLKFYIELYSKTPFIKVSCVIEAEAPQSETRINKFLKLFNQF